MVVSITNKRRFFAAIILFSMVLIPLGGCSLSNYGKLKSTPEVKQSFETYQITNFQPSRTVAIGDQRK